jgi:hypothetical protein
VRRARPAHPSLRATRGSALGQAPRRRPQSRRHSRAPNRARDRRVVPRLPRTAQALRAPRSVRTAAQGPLPCPLRARAQRPPRRVPGPRGRRARAAAPARVRGAAEAGQLGRRRSGGRVHGRRGRRSRSAQLERRRRRAATRRARCARLRDEHRAAAAALPRARPGLGARGRGLGLALRSLHERRRRSGRGRACAGPILERGTLRPCGLGAGRLCGGGERQRSCRRVARRALLARSRERDRGLQLTRLRRRIEPSALRCAGPLAFGQVHQRAGLGHGRTVSARELGAFGPATHFGQARLEAARALAGGARGARTRHEAHARAQRLALRDLSAAQSQYCSAKSSKRCSSTDTSRHL